MLVYNKRINPKFWFYLLRCILRRYSILNLFRIWHRITKKSCTVSFQIVKEKYRPWIFWFSSRTELRSFRGSRRITDKTETQKVQKRVRIELDLNLKMDRRTQKNPKSWFFYSTFFIKEKSGKLFIKNIPPHLLVMILFNFF